MSGILNNKQRFVDTVITNEGRRQLAAGEFQVEFATLSDSEVFYGGHPDSGSIDMSNQIQLEPPTNHPTDVITFETNLFGNVVSRIVPGVNIVSGSRDKLSGAFEFSDGELMSYNSVGGKNAVTGTAYQNTIAGILSGVIGNFTRLQTMGTLDPLVEDPEFRLSVSTANFEITDQNQDALSSLPYATLSEAESIFADRHLSHVPNFKFLPPRNRATSTNPTGSLLFDYPNNSQVPLMTLEDVRRNVSLLPSQEIEFTNTSIRNNLVCQLFEVSGEKLTKLSAIDFGEFVTDDISHPTKRYFFMGKVFPTDNKGTKTYVNMFTLEFD